MFGWPSGVLTEDKLCLKRAIEGGMRLDAGTGSPEVMMLIGLCQRAIWVFRTCVRARRFEKVQIRTSAHFERSPTNFQEELGGVKSGMNVDFRG